MSENVYSFTKLGYFLDYKSFIDFDFSRVNKSKYEHVPENELIEIGNKKLLESFSNLYENSKQVVVPLSGGVDSRLVLSVLLRFRSADSIDTYTFGIKGALDYDIGNLIAKKAGTRHLSIDLNNQTYGLDELIEASKRTDHQTHLFHNPPLQILDERFASHEFWSGIFGDCLAGNHLPNILATNTSDAYRQFLNRNSSKLNKGLLNHEDYDLFEQIIQYHFLPVDRITYEEQLDFKIREEKQVVPHVLIKPYAYKTPFINSPFFDFMLSLDNTKYRLGERFYQKLAVIKYNELFKYPLKNFHGARMGSRVWPYFLRLSNRLSSGFKGPNKKWLNYIDFDHAFRTNKELVNLAFENLSDLDKRKMIDPNYLDIDQIWKDHKFGHRNYGDLIKFLISLEIHLKAGKKV